MAKTAPQQLGLPFTTWSLTKLVEHLAQAHRLVVSTDTVRVILGEAGIGWQATKTTCPAAAWSYKSRMRVFFAVKPGTTSLVPRQETLTS